jgi:hypothetical protein
MNLSLLSTNFFSLGISVAVFHQKASWLYIVGFLCIPLAIVIFSLTGPKPESQAPPLQLGREEEHEKRTYLVPLQPEASSQAF